MMTEQERLERAEEAGDGCRNEFQRAFEVSRMTTPRRNVSAEVAKLVAAGHFVVVESWPVYCKFTDAILGESSRIAAMFQTYERALDWASKQAQDENTFLVYPLVPTPAPQVTVPQDDIPF